MNPTIAFELTQADLMAFRQYFVYTSPFGKRQIRIWQVAFCAIAVALIGQCLIVARGRGELSTSDIVALIVGSSFLAYAIFLLPRSFRKNWMKRMAKFDRHHSPAAQFGACSCSLEGDTLESRSPISSTRYSLQNLHKLVVFDSHAFIFVDGQSAVIIPKSRITEGNYTEFLAELQRRMNPASAAPAR